MAKASNRLRRNERFFTARRLIPSYMGRGSVLVGRTATGSPLVAMPGHVAKPCVPSRGKALTKAACKSELIFTTEGPKLRFCTAKGKTGPVMSVTGPSQATALASAFCACVKKKGANVKACAAKVGGSQLGRYHKKRRR